VAVTFRKRHVPRPPAVTPSGYGENGTLSPVGERELCHKETWVSAPISGITRDDLLTLRI